MKKDKKGGLAMHFNGSSSQKLSAKAEGRVAEQIIKSAKKHGIPLQKDEELTALLAKIQLNTEIPPELYLAGAQLLSFFYYLNKDKTQEKINPNN